MLSIHRVARFAGDEMRAMTAIKWLCLASFALILAGCSESGGSTPTDAGTTSDQSPTDSGNDTGPGLDTTTPDATSPDATTPDVPVTPPPGDWDPADFADVYDVGPGHPYADPSEVPWESLGADTLVRIHWRAEPYRDKWVINTVATESDPLVILGVAGSNGELPVIDGDNAKTRDELSYWNEVRSVIKIGGSNRPSDTLVPAWIYIESLTIQNAHPDHTFTNEGNTETYADNAASVHMEVGEHITLRNCEITGSGNGIFSGSQTSDVAIIGNYIHGNGISDSIYEHNTYTESLRITYEANHFGPLCATCPGNNLKDRSAGTVIRYNWIEAGNRQLDLVESDHEHILDDPSYAVTFVYGNVLAEPDGAGNSQMIHYGGDSGDTARYRNGTLHLFHNTFISTRGGNVTLVRMSSGDEHVVMHNNIMFSSAGGSAFALTAGQGDVTLGGNWLPTGWRETHESSYDGTLDNLGDNVEGDAPGFTGFDSQDFTLAEGSPCIGNAAALATGAPAADQQYVVHQGTEARSSHGAGSDVGAFEE